MMKKFLALILVLCIVGCFCACTNDSGNETTAPTNDTTQGVETTENKETTEATEATEDPTDDPAPTYTVKVVDEAGNPVAGAIVQLCKEACVPGVTNAEGVAEFFLPEDSYKVSFTSIPDGYVNDSTEENFYFADGSNEITLVLKVAE